MTLNLSSNAFRKLEPFSSQHFPALEILDLSHNFIAGCCPGAFSCGKLQLLDMSYNSMRKLDHVGVASLVSLDVSHNRITSVDEVEKLRVCTQIRVFAFNDNPLSQRISHRIRCLCLLRSVSTMDGRTVTESDLSQVRTILEQNEGMPPPMISGCAAKLNTVIVQPNLPQLSQQTGGQRRKPGRLTPF